MIDLEIEAELLTQDFKNMYVRWGNSTPARTGIHASAILEKEKNFCLRELVLLNLYGDQAEQGEWQSWDWKRGSVFENGWEIHRKWQTMFRRFGNVVWSPVSQEQADDIPAFSLKMIDGHTCAPELDLTHFDAERGIYFSPDAIIRFGGQQYIVEIKGIKQESYLELTDDLEQACAACETVHKAREQVNLYMHMLQLQRGIILVENKNTQDFRLWVVQYEQERAYPYIQRIYDVKGSTAIARMNGGELPLRCCRTINDARAKSCPMRAVCFAQKESEEW